MTDKQIEEKTTMSTERQLQANKANAGKSTGPRTQAGKARSRLNSRRHGLTAKTLIIVGECADDLERLRRELMDEYDPQSVMESEVVECLVGIIWRLRRVPAFQAAILKSRYAQVMRTRQCMLDRSGPTGGQDAESDWKAPALGLALMNDASSCDALGKLDRHQANLMNAFVKALQLLHLLQNNRSKTKGEPVRLRAVALPPAA